MKARRILLSVAVLCGIVSAEAAQPRVCRPVGEARPASFQVALDRPVPTHMKLMGFRYVRLQQAVDGFASTGRIMISRDDDGVFTPSECGDDPGLYLAAPALMRTAGLSLPTAIDVVLLVCLFVPFGYAAILFATDPKWNDKRKWIFMGLLAAFVVAILVGDLYLVSAAMAAGAVAIGLRANPGSKGIEAHLVLFGAMAAIANSFRGHSGTAAILFVLTAIALASGPLRKRLQMAAVLFSGFIMVAISLHVVLHQRDRFLEDKNGVTVVVNGHPFWHTIYVSLGYVNNPQVPALADASGVERVRQVDPSVPYYSDSYERILRSAVLDIVVHHPMVILSNLFAKTGTILLIAGVIVIPLRRRTSEPLWAAENLPFAVAACFSALAGVLAFPAPRYLAGMLAFVIIFGALRLAQKSSPSKRVFGASA